MENGGEWGMEVRTVERLCGGQGIKSRQLELGKWQRKWRQKDTFKINFGQEVNNT